MRKILYINTQELSGDIFKMVFRSLNTIFHNVPKFLPQKLKFKGGKFLFSFAKPQSLFSVSGVLREEGMMLCHMTDYIPKGGIIQTTRSATGAMRDSVHFSVNHSVLGHIGGDWSNKKFAILMPLKGARNMSGNSFAGGIATDFYSIGPVKIPPNSIRVRHNSKLPKEKYRIVNASEFKELTGLKKCNVIETSNPNFQEAVDDIISKSGYELRQTQDSFVWGTLKKNGQMGLKNFKKFNEYLKANGMTPMAHTYTPNGKVEQLYENISLLRHTSNDWVVKNAEGCLLVDHKTEIITALDEIIEQASKGCYPVTFDLQKIKTIVKKAKTPEVAIKELESLGIMKSLLDPKQIKQLQELPSMEQVKASIVTRRLLVGGPAFGKIDTNVKDYIDFPTFEKLKSLYTDKSLNDEITTLFSTLG
jgi:hypothetical protein